MEPRRITEPLCVTCITVEDSISVDSLLSNDSAMDFNWLSYSEMGFSYFCVGFGDEETEEQKMMPVPGG